MSSTKIDTVLTDTNALYKLYFFKRKNIIPSTNIIVPNLGRVEFHPIVLQELKEHIKFYQQHVSDEEMFKSFQFPQFLKCLSDAEITDLLDFTSKNLCRSISTVDTRGRPFKSKRIIYERERVRLQTLWKEQGEKGRKITSKPSDRDYSILVSAETHKCKILTHDEILSAVSTEFLGDGSLFRVEDVINQFYKQNNNLKTGIDSVLIDLSFLGEKIIKSRIFQA